MKLILNELATLLKLSFDFAKSIFSWKKKLSANEIKYVEQKRADSNVHRIFLYIIMVLIIQLSNYIVLTLTNAYVHKFEYFVASIYLLVIGFVFFAAITSVVNNIKKDNKLKMLKNICFGFWFFMSIGSLAFNALDIIEAHSVNNYVILVAATAIIPVFSFYEILSIISFDFLFDIIALLVLRKDVYLIQFSFLLSIVSIIISQSLFFTYIKSHISQKRLKVYAETDELTGLLNRHGLNEWIKNIKANCKNEKHNIAVALIDIDYFKEFNDKFGHLDGDECLKAIAHCLNLYYNKESNIVCRYGGEEFVVILSNVNEHKALNSFIKLKAYIQSNTRSKFDDKVITVSIGVAFSEITQDTNINDILKIADKSLYQAKESGRNLVVSGDGKIYS